MRRIVPLVVGLLCTAGLGGCDRFAPEDAVVLVPPAEFQTWWARTEQCSGREGRFARVRWFVVPGDSFACPSGRCVGRWEDDHTIYIAAGWLHDEMVVRHEMLHDLLDLPGHPNPPFGIGCPLTWSTWPGASPAVRILD
jgi:hypothetical protein